MSNKIKTIIPIVCPCCGKDILVGYSFEAPEVTSVFDPQKVANIKNDAIERIKTLLVDGEKKNEVIKWIQDESTVFGPDEVENIVMSLLKPE